MPSSTQLVVIGAGPGGYAAAFYAADRGMQVALVDPEPNPGGVCLYRGCIPSKALLHVAEVLNEVKHAEAWGVGFSGRTIDVKKVRAFKDKVVVQLTGGVGQVGRMRKINYIQGLAEFQDARTLKIARDGKDADTLTFEHAIIATGSRPASVPGLSIESDRVMDSTAALDLPDIPASLLVVGGGYIGLELGSVYAALGSKVTVVEMTDGLLPGADRDLVNILAKRIESMCDAVLLNTKVVSMKAAGNGVAVTVEGQLPEGMAKERTFDRVLIAVGRRPNSAVPGLDRTGVKVNQRGFIEVDPARATAEPGIYAIGDVVGEPMLAHKASHEARVAVDATGSVYVGDTFNHRVRKVTNAPPSAAFTANPVSGPAPLAIPAVVFTDPQLAWCGLTENEAQKQKREVAVTRFPWGASGRAITLDRTDGMTKLILDPRTERVLGVGIVGPGAGELISEGVLAIEMGATASDVKLSIHPHPTLSETLMESAETFFGQATHVYKPKRAK